MGGLAKPYPRLSTALPVVSAGIQDLRACLLGEGRFPRPRTYPRKNPFDGQDEFADSISNGTENRRKGLTLPGRPVRRGYGAAAVAPAGRTPRTIHAGRDERRLRGVGRPPRRWVVRQDSRLRPD